MEFIRIPFFLEHLLTLWGAEIYLNSHCYKSHILAT